MVYAPSATGDLNCCLPQQLQKSSPPKAFGLQTLKGFIKMSFKIKSYLVALAMFCALPAFAQQNATAGAEANAGAIASALVKTGKVYSNGGLGCPNGFATPIVSYCWKTKHDKNMEQANLIIDAANSGFFFTNDVAMTVMYRAVGYDYKGMREVTKATTVSTKSASAIPAETQITVKVLKADENKVSLQVNGQKYSITGDKLTDWNANRKMKFNGVILRKSDVPA